MQANNQVLKAVKELGLLISVIFIAGILAAYYTKLQWTALNLMLGLVAIIAFFGVLIIPGGWSKGNGFSEGRVRLALASTLVILFVASFATTIFWFNTSEETLGSSDLRTRMVDTLTDLLKIVIPFYFGATAATEYAKIRGPRGSSNTNK